MNEWMPALGAAWRRAAHRWLQRAKGAIFVTTTALVSANALALSDTTTSLAASPSPAYVGQTVTLTVTVAGASPTGTVTFKDGSSVLGTSTLSAGKATRTVSFSSTGDHTLTAAYAGDAANAPSTSAPVVLTINAKSDTATSLTVSPTRAYVGQNLAMTATVSGNGPTRTVTFMDGSTSLGSATVSGGQATLTKAISTAGIHSLTAVYTGDTANNGSASSPVSVTIDPKTDTTTALSANPSPAIAGQNVTLSVTVTGSTPTGSVTFKDGSTTLGTASISAGQASLVKAFATAGTHSLTAVYAGDTVNNASTSAPFSLTVNAATSTTSLAASPSPAFAGQTVTLTATVTGANPSGVVTFMDGSATLRSSNVSSGRATLSSAFSTTGNHSLTASYAGDGGNSASASNPVTLAVNPKNDTTTSLTANPNPAFVGQNVTLTATISGVSPTGTVTFLDGSTSLGSASVSAGKATLVKSFSTTGDHSLSASYAGDAGNNASVSPAVVLTANPKNTTTTTLSFTPNPAYVAQNVTFTATVAGVNPTGTVTFMDGATSLGSTSLSSGKAMLTKSLATAADHSITAVYAGDTGNNSSTSAAQTLTIAPKNNTTTALAASPNPAFVNQTVTLTATVTGVSPTGTVTFKDGATTLGSASLSNGNATFTKSFSTPGSHSFTASYAGDTGNNASASATVAQTIVLHDSSTGLNANVPLAEVGQNVVLYASVSGTNATGTVTFKDGSTTIGTATLNAGQASVSTSFSTAGVHSLTAVYGGDANNASSASSALALAVNASASVVTLSATPNPVSPGQTISLAAAVSGASPSGTVSFRDGTVLLGTATVTNGSASITANLGTPGLHVLTAAYSGDASNQPSTSQTVGALVEGNSAATPPTAMAWSYQYDTKGSLTQVTDPNGATTDNAYDPLEQRTQTLQPAPAAGQARPSVGMAYDAQGQLTQVTDPRGLQTTYTADGLGNTTLQHSPDSGDTQASFTELGQLAARTDARGKTARYSYDTLNRLSRIDYATGAPTVISYDGGPNAVGRLSGFSDESGTTTYGYDGFGHVSSKTQTVVSSAASRAFTVGYAWGASGNTNGKLQALLYPSGKAITLGYDAAGRINSIAVNGITLLSAVTYNALNAPQSWVWGDGTPYRRAFDAYGRLSTYPLGNPSGSGNAAGVLRTLSYDMAGRIVGYSHGGAAALDQLFSYDPLDRLTSAQASGTNYGYAFDANGNRTQSVINGTVYTLSVSPSSNRYTTVQTPGNTGTQTQTLGYDAAGNLVSDGAGTYGYSDRGRMSSGTVAAGTVSYLYNALEQRVFKGGPPVVIVSGTAYYVYDEQDHLLGEYDASGTPLYETVYLGDTPVAVMKVDGGVGYVYADHLGAPRVIVRSTDHAIVWRWDSTEPFGRTAANANPNGLGTYVFNQRFPGQIADAESGWFYNLHRDYDPTVGAYKQSDPIGLRGGISTYAYSAQNPQSYIDPQGLQGCIPVMTPSGPMCLPTGPGPVPGAGAGGGSESSPGSGSGSGSRIGDGGDGRGSCTLYHIIDCAGEVVYVGITQQDPRERESQHMSRIDGKIRLWECVLCKLTFVPIKTYQTRAECKAAESQQIRALRPLFNDAENPDGPLTLYERRREWFNRRCILCQ